MNLMLIMEKLIAFYLIFNQIANLLLIITSKFCIVWMMILKCKFMNLRKIMMKREIKN